MADFQVVNYLPAKFRQNPVWTELADVFQQNVVTPTLANVRSLFRARRADLPIESLFIGKVVDTHEVGTKISFDIGKRIIPYSIQISAGAYVIDTSLSAVGKNPGTYDIDWETGTGWAAFDVILLPGAAVQVLYQADTALDPVSLQSLRRTLGLTIDITGFDTNTDSTITASEKRTAVARRLTSDATKFYEIAATKRFIDFLSYCADADLQLEELFTYTIQNLLELPSSTKTLSFEGGIIPSSVIAAYGIGKVIRDDGYGNLVGDVGTGRNSVDYETGRIWISLPDDYEGSYQLRFADARYNEFFESPMGSEVQDGGLWYKTSRVNLYNDRSRLDLNTEQLSNLFYQAAPINLVLNVVGKYEIGQAFAFLGGVAQIEVEL